MSNVPSTSRSTSPAAPSAEDRPGLAFVLLAPAPYRTHLQLRIAREIGEIKLHSIYTHGVLEGHASTLADRFHRGS